MNRPARLCSISTAPSRERRTAAARRWNVPCTTNSFSVVRTTRVRPPFHPARSAMRAPPACSRTPAIEAGHPMAMQPMPTRASASARTNGPASTTTCRRSSRQTRSQPEVIIAFAAFARRRKIPGHEGNSSTRRPLDSDRHSDRRGGAGALEAEARTRTRLSRLHPGRSSPPWDREARAGRRPERPRPPHPLRGTDRRDRPRPLDRRAPGGRPGAERPWRNDESPDPPGGETVQGDQARRPHAIDKRLREVPKAGQLLHPAVEVTLKVFEVLLGIFFVLATAAYWIFERARAVDFVASLLPRPKRKKLRDTWDLI